MRMVMVVAVDIHIHGNHAAVFGECTTNVLKLDRGVPDMETLRQHIVQALQNAIAGRRR